MTTQAFARLFIMFAREAHRAVIFRNGPRIWTQAILWNTDTDVFTEGQWLKGTLYTKRCDVSPDGSKMIYFSAKHYKGYKPDRKTDVQNNWTAISRPPYFTSLAMWDCSDTWGGGGYFENNTTAYVPFSNYETDQQTYAIPPSFKLKSFSSEYPMAVEDSIYYRALLQKRGWVRIPEDASLDWKYPMVWRKNNPDNSYHLIMILLSGSGTERYGSSFWYGIRITQNSRSIPIIMRTGISADA